MLLHLSVLNLENNYKLDILKSAVQKYLRRREFHKMVWCVGEIYLFQVYAKSDTEKRATKGIISNLLNRLIIMLDEEMLFAECEKYVLVRRYMEDFEKSDLKYLVIKHVNGNYSAGAQLGENINALMDDVSAAALKLWNCKKPVISLVDGIAAGAGSNMMLLSDFIIATPETRFIEVFVRRGLVVDFGGSWVLPRIIGIQKAKELMMTSNAVSYTHLTLPTKRIV